jgi:hypothetical protein
MIKGKYGTANVYAAIRAAAAVREAGACIRLTGSAALNLYMPYEQCVPANDVDFLACAKDVETSARLFFDVYVATFAAAIMSGVVPTVTLSWTVHADGAGARTMHLRLNSMLALVDVTFVPAAGHDAVLQLFPVETTTVVFGRTAAPVQVDVAALDELLHRLQAACKGTATADGLFTQFQIGRAQTCLSTLYRLRSLAQWDKISATPRPWDFAYLVSEPPDVRGAANGVVAAFRAAMVDMDSMAARIHERLDHMDARVTRLHRVVKGVVKGVTHVAAATVQRVQPHVARLEAKIVELETASLSRVRLLVKLHGDAAMHQPMLATTTDSLSRTQRKLSQAKDRLTDLLEAAAQKDRTIDALRALLLNVSRLMPVVTTVIGKLHTRVRCTDGHMRKLIATIKSVLRACADNTHSMVNVLRKSVVDPSRRIISIDHDCEFMRPAILDMVISLGVPPTVVDELPFLSATQMVAFALHRMALRMCRDYVIGGDSALLHATLARAKDVSTADIIPELRRWMSSVPYLNIDDPEPDFIIALQARVDEDEPDALVAVASASYIRDSHCVSRGEAAKITSLMESERKTMAVHGVPVTRDDWTKDVQTWDLAARRLTAPFVVYIDHFVGLAAQLHTRLTNEIGAMSRRESLLNAAQDADTLNVDVLECLRKVDAVSSCITKLM